MTTQPKAETDEKLIERVRAQIKERSPKLYVNGSDWFNVATVAELCNRLEAVGLALKPFAAFGSGDSAGIARAFYDLEDDVLVYENAGCFITAGDFRAASAALRVSGVSPLAPNGVRWALSGDAGGHPAPASGADKKCAYGVGSPNCISNGHDPCECGARAATPSATGGADDKPRTQPELDRALDFLLTKPATPAATEAGEQPECKVCGNKADEHGEIRHGKGCYMVSEDGGGSSFVDVAGEQPTRPDVTRLKARYAPNGPNHQREAAELIAWIEHLEREPATPPIAAAEAVKLADDVDAWIEGVVQAAIPTDTVDPANLLPIANLAIALRSLATQLTTAIGERDVAQDGCADACERFDTERAKAAAAEFRATSLQALVEKVTIALDDLTAAYVSLALKGEEMLAEKGVIVDDQSVAAEKAPAMRQARAALTELKAAGVVW